SEAGAGSGSEGSDFATSGGGASLEQARNEPDVRRSTRTEAAFRMRVSLLGEGRAKPSVGSRVSERTSPGIHSQDRAGKRLLRFTPVRQGERDKGTANWAERRALTSRSVNNAHFSRICAGFME